MIKYLSAVAITALVVFAAWPGRALAAEPITSSNIGNYIRNAKTADDHEAIAAYYDAEAARANEAVKAYRNQYDCYVEETAKRGAKFERSASASAQRYCVLLYRHYAEIAKEDKALAEEHRKIAKQMEAGAKSKPAESEGAH
jgi:hypothetical protein